MAGPDWKTEKTEESREWSDMAVSDVLSVCLCGMWKIVDMLCRGLQLACQAGGEEGRGLRRLSGCQAATILLPHTAREDREDSPH